MKKRLWKNELLGDILMWLLVALVVVFGYWLGGIVNLSGFIIAMLIWIIFNMAGNMMENGQGIALLTLAFSGWFLIGFVPGLVMSNWSLWFS